ncbi:MAG TPA: hypothetical protein VIY28_08745 [Pseudonocardiaceae bacterium]
MTSPAYDQAATPSSDDAVAPGETPLENPDEDLFEPDWERPRRTNRLTAVLVTGLIAAAAFAGGVAVQKNHDTGLTAAMRAASGPRNPAAGGGSRARTGADVPVVVGTIESISGTTVKVTNSAGSVITVTVPPTATVTTTGPAGLTVGEQVSVVGTKTADTAVTATALTTRNTPG